MALCCSHSPLMELWPLFHARPPHAAATLVVAEALRQHDPS
eukprot:COSAG01_NODE_7346_length_3242_cov_5.263124_1_plen_41_part_00